MQSPFARHARIVFATALVFASSCDTPTSITYDTTAGPTAVGDAVVITDHELASRAGAHAIARGGNAVDAMVAAALALAVVRPEAGNLAGGGFMMVHIQDAAGGGGAAGNGTGAGGAGGDGAGAGGAGTIMIDCRETAPAAATPDMFLDADGELDPELSLWSGRAAGVPGTVAGLEHAHRRFGTLPWETLVEPAIALASGGFEIQSYFASLLDDYDERLSRSPATGALVAEARQARVAGTPWRQPELARTLSAIRDGGAAAFYSGEHAARLVDAVNAWRGLMTTEDMESYRVVDRTPVRSRYRGYDVVSGAPPSSGGGIVLLLLRMTELLDLRRLAADPGTLGHTMIEIMRRGFAVRATELGDPGFVDIDMHWILESNLARDFVTSISARASLSDTLRLPGRTRASRSILREGGDTTHLIAVDTAGNIASFTTTLNATFGSGIVVPGGGYFLNNEMDDFTTRPGTPNLYGLIQGEQNAVEPGKRPLSSMSPTILFEDGEPVMTLGSPGGSRIISAVYQVLASIVELGIDPETAVRRPRLHHQFLPDAVRYEEGAFRDGGAALAARGHALADEPAAVGHVHLAVRRPDGRWLAVADQRRGGSAIALSASRQ